MTASSYVIPSSAALGTMKGTPGLGWNEVEWGGMEWGGLVRWQGGEGGVVGSGIWSGVGRWREGGGTSSLTGERAAVQLRHALAVFGDWSVEPNLTCSEWLCGVCVCGCAVREVRSAVWYEPRRGGSPPAPRSARR